RVRLGRSASAVPGSLITSARVERKADAYVAFVHASPDRRSKERHLSPAYRCGCRVVLLSPGIPVWLPCRAPVPGQTGWVARACTPTGWPDGAAVPVSSSTQESSVTSLMLTPGCLVATDSRTPRLPCPQLCGRFTAPGMTSSLTSTGARTSPTAEDSNASAPSASPSRCASEG